jgi:hypothetical protein
LERLRERDRAETAQVGTDVLRAPYLPVRVLDAGAFGGGFGYRDHLAAAIDAGCRLEERRQQQR